MSCDYEKEYSSDQQADWREQKLQSLFVYLFIVSTGS